MSKYLQAADDARRLLRGFAAVSELADAFEEVGKLEQARAEHEGILVQLRTDLGSIKEQIEQANTELAAVRQDASKTVADAKAIAEGIVSTAQLQADSIAFKADASVIEANDKVAAAVDQGKQDLEALRLQHEGLAAEVKALEDRVAEARAYLAKLAG